MTDDEIILQNRRNLARGGYAALTADELDLYWQASRTHWCQQDALERQKQQQRSEQWHAHEQQCLMPIFARWEAARAAKDWALADQLREHLGGWWPAGWKQTKVGL